MEFYTFGPEPHWGRLDDPQYLVQTRDKIGEFEAWVNDSRREDLRWVVDMCVASTDRWQQDWEGALASYLKAIEIMPDNDLEEVRALIEESL